MSRGSQVLREFYKVLHLVRAEHEKTFENSPLTAPQGMLVMTLKKNGPCKISQLSKLLMLSNSTVSGIVDRLERDGVVLRKRSEEDRRVVYVSLSEGFLEGMKEHWQGVEEKYAGLLNRVSEEEMLAIEKGLSLLYKALSQDQEEEDENNTKKP